MVIFIFATSICAPLDDLLSAQDRDAISVHALSSMQETTSWSLFDESPELRIL